MLASLAGLKGQKCQRNQVLLSPRNRYNTKPDKIGAVAGGVPITDGGAAVPSIVVPRPAAQRPVLTSCCALRIGLVATGIIAIPIRTPFPNIAMHIKQSPGIGELEPHGVQLRPRWRAVPASPVGVGLRSARGERRRRGRPAGVFPFRFGR